MDDKFVENLLLLNSLTKKLASLCIELEKVNSAFYEIATTTFPQPETLKPEDYD